MGTRGSFGVRIDQTDKLTYNHFDSYPEYLGNAVVRDVRELLKRKNGLEKLKAEARALLVVKSDGTPTPEDIDKYGKYGSTGIGRQTLTDWYCLLRNLQGKLAETLKAGVIVDGNAFILDSLFCEYAYIVNLDSEELEVYEGFQTERPATSRYADGRQPHDEYWGCALKATFPLSDIPENWAAIAFPARAEENEEAA